jgi:AcrR family transcriptional regulator
MTLFSRAITLVSMDVAGASPAPSAPDAGGDRREDGAPGAERIQGADRRRLIAEASALLEEAGPEGFSLRGLVKRTGSSTQAVYTLFGGKSGLLDAVYADTCVKLCAAVSAAALGGSGPVAGVTAMIMAYREFAMRHPALYSLVFSRPIPAYRPSRQSLAAASETKDKLIAAVAAGRAAGALGAAAAAATDDELAERVWTIAHGMVSLERVCMLTSDTPARLEAAVTALLRN